MPITAHTSWHSGRPPRQQQSVVSSGILPSKASVYCCAGIQMTRLRPVPKHPLALLEQVSPLYWVKERLFFYPRCQGMTRDTRCTFYTPHTTSFLVHTEDFFLTLWTVCFLFRLENAARLAVIAKVLLLGVAIMSIEDNILATAFTTAIRKKFGYHCLVV